MIAVRSCSAALASASDAPSRCARSLSMPVDHPPDLEVIAWLVLDVAYVEPLVATVSTRSDKAEEATAVLGVVRPTTADQRVVAEEPRPRVVQPRIEPSTSRMAKDPAVPLILLQETDDVVFRLRLLGVRRAHWGSGRCRLGRYPAGKGAGCHGCNGSSRHRRGRSRE
jgi:hypothetical protein